MERVGTFISELQDHERMIICGHFNSESQTTSVGKIASDLGSDACDQGRSTQNASAAGATDVGASDEQIGATTNPMRRAWMGVRVGVSLRQRGPGRPL